MSSDFKPKTRAEKVAYWKWEFVRRNPEYGKKWKEYRDILLKDKEAFRKGEEISKRFRQSVELTRKELLEIWQIPCDLGETVPYSPADDEGWRPYLNFYELFSPGEVRVSEMDILIHSLIAAGWLLPEILGAKCSDTPEDIARCAAEPLYIFAKMAAERWQSALEDLAKGTDKYTTHEDMIKGLTDRIHIEVPLGLGKMETKKQVDEILDKYLWPKKQYFGQKQYQDWLRVYDLKIQGKTYREILREDPGLDDVDINDDRIRDLKRQKKRVKNLIEQGWREIQ